MYNQICLNPLVGYCRCGYTTKVKKKTLVGMYLPWNLSFTEYVSNYVNNYVIINSLASNLFNTYLKLKSQAHVYKCNSTIFSIFNMASLDLHN